MPGLASPAAKCEEGQAKERQRAIFKPFTLFMQVTASLVLSFVGDHHAHLVLGARDLLCVSGSLLGAAIESLLFRSLSDRHHARAIDLLLIVSGAGDLI